MVREFARRLYRRFVPPTLAWRRKGVSFAAQWLPPPGGPPPAAPARERSPLEEFFDARVEGPGIWKWRHYFDIYHRHFDPLRRRDDLVILEIGIYSGGSLDMWRGYFGSSATIYGVDIEPACRTYERPGTHVLVGDQADRAFWRRVLADGTLAAPDVVIDDGGHTPEQQRVTLEELLPRMRPGGVYLCEDVHGGNNAFAAFVAGLADRLNGMEGRSSDSENPERRMVVPANGVQATLHSVHLYPFVVVIEKRNAALPELVAPKRGSQWEPFLR
jgi:hypothetical protein